MKNKKTVVVKHSNLTAISSCRERLAWKDKKGNWDKEALTT